MPTDFPKAGDDKAVSLRNSSYARFDLAYAQDLKDNHPKVWGLGGNIRGNAQFAILSRIQKQGGSPKTRAEEKAVRLREAWAAQHFGNKRPPGVVAQMKWLVVGELGEQRMKNLINGEKDKRNGRSSAGEAGGAEARHVAPEPAGDGGLVAPDGVLLRTALVRAVRREARPTAANPDRKLVVVEFIASTEDIDSHESILIADWAGAGRLARYQDNPVLLWMHCRWETTPAIGHCEKVRVEGKNLLATAVFDDSTEFDREIAAKYEKGVLRAFSVGFAPGKCEVRVVDGREIAVFSENELREISGVNVPSNAKALVTGQRDLVSTAREMARAAGGSVAMSDVLTRMRTEQTLTRDVPAAARIPTTEPPVRGHGVPMATPTSKKIVQTGERDVRATDHGAALDVSCPHCEAPFEVQAVRMPLPSAVAADLDATRTALATDRASLTEARALLEAEQKRAASLEAKLADASRTLSGLLLSTAESDVESRVGKKIEPHERDEEVALARLFLADSSPDLDGPKDADGKATRTLGQRKWAERLAKLDQRRDIGLLTAPITTATPLTGPDATTRAAADPPAVAAGNTTTRGGDAFAQFLETSPAKA